MKKILLLLLIMMLTKTTAFSENILIPINQDSIVVATSDIKYANLIFVEHKKLKTENILLKDEINKWKEINHKQNELDSLNKIQLVKYNNHILDLNKQIKRKNNIIKGLKIGGITITIGLTLLLIFTNK